MASDAQAGTIDPREAAHFGAQAADWWDPEGGSAMLHKLGPARLGYIREAIDRHWHGDSATLRPLAGKRALDIGCGAGLVAEPLARMGAAVTAIDAAPENIAVARAHADAMGLAIDYRACGVETLAEPRYDLITTLEVIEHVSDPALFLAAIARLLKPDGLLILSTPNRTPLSRLLIVSLAEGLGTIPRGTHDWSRFITPDEMETQLAAQGLQVVDRKGLLADPRYGFVLSDNLALNYILAITQIPA
ncbi:bifunctional 2-polyprenyl-6-hydroxyphenol methylase/3-demethylubiquinol 3-O-methyltransferase UbiG [Sphingobium lignivorans]|uniref:Ubiquinone biosynthesis O-methyltransferase n=1 Tax=Sphingobium lignivorans TaxID=2735886 RepID=A0ABR6NE01_9SPHN|nr:bifunctional 2-polyprenyl-6-hydroxyphenol methylase/3-demethylubiquinol 3-O-methyltransferase UbiG [Sphingobium lignivorans]MBB5985510.1 2-polyprenyl-6-hydroxyphenyl methylase/3-demethylubiquinone-9 3-methyltransferase [Sphingobium lignivorans]